MESSNKNEFFLVRVGPFQYIHILDTNTNITSIFVGPGTYVCKENESLSYGPDKMINLLPMEFCIIFNPVRRDSSGNALFYPNGQVQLLYGDLEYRFHRDPFPLYPGEELHGPIRPLTVVSDNNALLLYAKTLFTDSEDKVRQPGDKWCFIGPGTYFPRKEAEVIEHMEAKIINFGEALVLTAQKDILDFEGKPRVTGEQWLVAKPGAYLLGPYETLVETIKGIALDEKTAVQVKAEQSHVDENKIKRKHGEEWLVTHEDTDCYIRNVSVSIVKMVPITTLNSRQYCVILDPVTEQGKPHLGSKLLVLGEKSFFLRPGESLENGVQDIYLLTENEGLVLTARTSFIDYSLSLSSAGKSSSDSLGIKRSPGERWLIRGPMEYVPPVEVKVICKRSSIPLDENEGIYVLNTTTGRIRAVIGNSYMLNHEEELWAKPLPLAVQRMLAGGKDPLADRSSYQHQTATPENPLPQLDLTRVVSFRVPHNAAVRIYDYSRKLARIIFGPDLVMLGPDEHFTILSLSGGKPKQPGMISSICLLLGPDFCTDVIVVETADHARLSLQLSYNWGFMADRSSSVEHAAKLFSVPDFVGDMCKAVASRIRGNVASVSFDDFHKNSARIIRTSVFGMDSNNKIRDSFVFPQNNLAITSIDVQSVEPVDQRTRDSLQKSVQLAIEITTNSQEAAAKHEANCREQEAKGRLERQRIEDEVAAEKGRQRLLELQVESAAMESTGQAKAEAMSRAESSIIEAKGTVERAKLKSQALELETSFELEQLTKARQAELQYMVQKNELELKYKSEQDEIDVHKFSEMVKSFGPDTLRSIACAGPDHEVRLLQSLGLKSAIITDGNSPLNLFTTAHGLIGKVLDA